MQDIKSLELPGTYVIDNHIYIYIYMYPLTQESTGEIPNTNLPLLRIILSGSIVGVMNRACTNSGKAGHAESDDTDTKVGNLISMSSAVEVFLTRVQVRWGNQSLHLC